MNIQIFENYKVLSAKVAEIIVETINKKPNALICLGSGDTPIGVFESLVEMSKNAKADFSNVQFVGLDEWLGMDENDEGSCFYTMFQKLFVPLHLNQSQIHCFDAKSENLELECEKINNLIEKNDGLDLILLGIGTNGHLAMNEPGTPFEIGCHVSKLAESTISTGQKYFKKNTPLNLGITVGLGQIAASKKIILMANGSKKAEIIAKTVSSEANVNLPSSLLLKLKNVEIMIDKEAGALVKA